MGPKKPTKGGKGNLRSIVTGAKGVDRKQSELEGMEREVDEDLEVAIEKLQKAKAKRTKAKVEVDSATDTIADLLEAREVKTYVSVAFEAKVALVEKRKVSLKKYVVKESGLEAAE